MSQPPKEHELKPASGAANQADQQGMLHKEGKHGANEGTFPPTLSAFFSDSKISPSAFFKAIKSQQIKRFAPEDEAQALALVGTNDPDGGRLWELISQSSLPDPVDRWVWRAAQDRLGTIIGSEFDPAQNDAGRILTALRDALSRALRAREKHPRKRAENWLRIGICWLVEKRSLQPWAVAEAVLPVLFHENKRALHASRRVLQRGRSNEFKLAVAMAGLAHEIVRAAHAERDAERRVAADLRHQLTEARSIIEDLRSRLTSLQSELKETSQSLHAVQAQLQAERQHWGHDLSETKAEQRMLLSERVAPLLSDAIDALEIEPPAPHVALRRLKSVLSLVGGAKS